MRSVYRAMLEYPTKLEKSVSQCLYILYFNIQHQKKDQSSLLEVFWEACATCLVVMGFEVNFCFTQNYSRTTMLGVEYAVTDPVSILHLRRGYIAPSKIACGDSMPACVSDVLQSMLRSWGLRVLWSISQALCEVVQQVQGRAHCAYEDGGDRQGRLVGNLAQSWLCCFEAAHTGASSVGSLPHFG